MSTDIVSKLLNTEKVNICVPLCGTSREALTQEIALLEQGIDMVEWRMDYFSGEKPDDWLHALQVIRPLLRSYPLLATWRSKKEGGMRDFSMRQYEELLKVIIQSKLVDMIDIELFSEEACLQRLVACAHEHDVAVVISNHAMNDTPDIEAMSIRLKAMKRMQADIVKLAVMPNSMDDVWKLLQASSAFHEQYRDCPLITMAMGQLGVITRICGEMSGSLVSFAALKEVSAPGQLPWKQLRSLLEEFHRAYHNEA